MKRHGRSLLMWKCILGVRRLLHAHVGCVVEVDLVAVAMRGRAGVELGL